MQLPDVVPPTGSAYVNVLAPVTVIVYVPAVPAPLEKLMSTWSLVNKPWAVAVTVTVLELLLYVADIRLPPAGKVS